MAVNQYGSSTVDRGHHFFYLGRVIKVKSKNSKVKNPGRFYIPSVVLSEMIARKERKEDAEIAKL